MEGARAAFRFNVSSAITSRGVSLLRLFFSLIKNMRTLKVTNKRNNSIKALNELDKRNLLIVVDSAAAVLKNLTHLFTKPAPNIRSVPFGNMHCKASSISKIMHH